MTTHRIEINEGDTVEIAKGKSRVVLGGISFLDDVNDPDLHIQFDYITIDKPSVSESMNNKKIKIDDCIEVLDL